MHYPIATTPDLISRQWEEYSTKLSVRLLAQQAMNMVGIGDLDL